MRILFTVLALIFSGPALAQEAWFGPADYANYAVSNGDLEMAHNYAGFIGTEINDADGYYLRTAARNGDVPMTSFLLDLGADPRVMNDAPIRLAAGLGHLDVVKLLLSQGAVSSVFADDELVLLEKSGQAEVADFLRSLRAPPLPE